MNTKTMEGIAGASMSMKILNTPLRVYKEAERRGDTATMERAMGYVNEFSDKAEDYKKETEKGMKEDAKEAREKAKLEQEKAIKKRREEHEKLEKEIEESQNKNTDTVSISEEGKVILKEKSDIDQDNTDSSISAEKTVDAIDMEPVIYTKNKEAIKQEAYANSFSSISILK